VQQSAIEETLSELRSLRRDHVEDRNEIADELDELKARRQELESVQKKRERYQNKLTRIEEELAERAETVETLEEKIDEFESKVQELEADVEELERQEYEEILELHREVNELEFERDQLVDERDAVEAEIAQIEADLDERDALQNRRASIKSELETLRTRIDRLEENAVEEFNTHMQNLLDHLGYDNIERIWIERTVREVKRGRKSVTEQVFDLHVVRSTDEGATYEDTIEHLSESEREVAGLVFALAGYLTHEVYDMVPFMLLDSLEAIDSNRIAALVEYFADYADYLVVALLPEDAQALDDGYERVRSI
jgi:chromosome segregation ATPase